jgi:hypothetical protein
LIERLSTITEVPFRASATVNELSTSVRIRLSFGAVVDSWFSVVSLCITATKFHSPLLSPLVVQAHGALAQSVVWMLMTGDCGHFFHECVKRHLMLGECKRSGSGMSQFSKPHSLTAIVTITNNRVAYSAVLASKMLLKHTLRMVLEVE